MENKEYLNEERYQKNNNTVKKIGKGLLAVGIIGLVLGGLFVIVGMFGNYLLLGLGVILSTIGGNLALISIIPIVIANRRKIVAYRTQQVMPIAQEGIEKMTPTIAKSAEEIAKGVKRGLNDTDNE